jgi:hypothetical protein
MTLQVCDGDLLNQDVEVIVNAWNRNIIPWWLLLPLHMPTQRSLQLVDQGRLHVAVDVLDLQADDLLPIQSLTELLPQYPPVLLLHDEDPVSPTNMPLVHPDSCAWFCPG